MSEDARERVVAVAEVLRQLVVGGVAEARRGQIGPGRDSTRWGSCVWCVRPMLVDAVRLLTRAVPVLGGPPAIRVVPCHPVSPTVLRIAHGYGNRRARIARALAAGVDLIEADLRWWRGDVWVRHEHRMARLPVLYNHRLGGIHRAGPWAIPAGPWWLRLDVAPIRLADLLRLVSGRAGLMIDLKRDRLAPGQAAAFVEAALDELGRFGVANQSHFCGGWEYLDLVRARLPGAMVHYSVDGAGDWRQVQQRLEEGAPFPAITLKRRLLDEPRARLLHEAGIPFITWDIETRFDAESAIELGAEGLIADDLELLKSLKDTPLRGPALTE